MVELDFHPSRMMSSSSMEVPGSSHEARCNDIYASLDIFDLSLPTSTLINRLKTETLLEPL